ncbi:MAG: hypothetical protein JXA78_14065 [Anaerolineales bacterium]|nr:hypothetical protein [Anaerolineales bacterium]
MKDQMTQMILLGGRINRQHIQFILLILSLSLLVIGAGAPAGAGGGSPG